MYKFNKSHGFTLIELSIALLIGAAILVYAIPAYKAFGLDKQKSITLKNHALMIKQVNDAMGSWAANSYADIADDSSGTILATDLKTDDYLPARFGEQYVTNSTQDLMGADLRIYYSKTLIEFNGIENQTLRTFATVDSPLNFQDFPDNYLSERYSNPLNQSEYDSFVSYWYTELSRIASENDLVVGTIRKNSNLVVAVNKAFRFSLDEILFPITERPYDRIVVFWGWPDLNGFPGGLDTPDPDSDVAHLYKGCIVSTRDYYQTVQQSEQCLANGLKPLINMESFSTTSPSPFTYVPGFGMVYSYVSRQAITDLSSLGSNCYSIGYSYCFARAGTGFRACGTSNPEQFNLLVDSCQSTPVYELINNMVLNGGTYKSSPLYKEGEFTFGTHNGVRYEVNAGGVLGFNKQYTLCCPLDVPDLE